MSKSEWGFAGTIENFFDEKVVAMQNFVNAYTTQINLYALEAKEPSKVSEPMIQKGKDEIDGALNILIEAEFAWRVACRRRRAEQPPGMAEKLDSYMRFRASCEGMAYGHSVDYFRLIPPDDNGLRRRHPWRRASRG
jgi:hypothetical protein